MTGPSGAPLPTLVSGLPEVYHPIFGHPELSTGASRESTDRLARIVEVHDALRRLLGRPLRVLDLGCAQGFFSLSLAERGAMVRGVDRLRENIGVCEALAQEHPELQARFEVAGIEDLLPGVAGVEYDLLLGLSVWHHVVQERGVDAARELIDTAIRIARLVIVELADRSEPMYWAAAQPPDPRALLQGAAFVHEIGRYGTHLSTVRRPLFVASTGVWFLEGLAGSFDEWRNTSHVLEGNAYEGTRRYFFSESFVVKMFELDGALGETNRLDLDREAELLRAAPSDLGPVPHLIASGANEHEAWLVRQFVPGDLLIDLMRRGEIIDGLRVLRDVLAQTAALERSGLYHGDIRAWNVLIQPHGGAVLIDYGSITREPADCVWPGNVFLAFLIFVRELATGVVDDPSPMRTASISPYNLPAPYRAWALALWQRPFQEWSFRLMAELLDALPTLAQEEPLTMPADAWAQAVENALQIHTRLVRQLTSDVQTLRDGVVMQTERLHEHIQWLRERADAAERELARRDADMLSLQMQLERTTAQLRERTAVAEDLHRELTLLWGSRSWRYTLPLREGGLVVRAGVSRVRSLFTGVRAPAGWIARRASATGAREAASSPRLDQVREAEEELRLSPGAARVLADLQQAIREKRG